VTPRSGRVFTASASSWLLRLGPALRLRRKLPPRLRRPAPSGPGRAPDALSPALVAVDSGRSALASSRSKWGRSVVAQVFLAWRPLLAQNLGRRRPSRRHPTYRRARRIGTGKRCASTIQCFARSLSRPRVSGTENHSRPCTLRASLEQLPVQAISQFVWSTSYLFPAAAAPRDLVRDFETPWPSGSRDGYSSLSGWSEAARSLPLHMEMSGLGGTVSLCILGDCASCDRHVITAKRAG